MFIYLATYSDTALLILRVFFGGIMIARGLPKLRGIVRDRSFHKAAAGILEFFGGAAIALGLLIQPLAALFAVELSALVIWKIAKKKPLVGGWDMEVLLLGASLIFLAMGAGEYSLDIWRYFLPYGF